MDRLECVFDDERAVANAGLLLAATLAGRLGLEELVDEAVDLGAAGRGAAGREGVVAGARRCCSAADSIDDCDVLRCGETQRVLGHRVMAPSTLGTFLRAFTFGHVRQLDRVLERRFGGRGRPAPGRAAERLMIDLDSFVVEVHGDHKQGASFGYTKRRGYHPILATRSDTGEVLHVRLRKGSANSQRGAERFVDELVARVRRAGASGQMLVRADSGFWSNKTIAALEQHGDRATRSASASRRTSRRAIAASLSSLAAAR